MKSYKAGLTTMDKERKIKSYNWFFDIFYKIKRYFIELNIYKNGLYIDEDDCYIWYKNGKRHREDGPAVEQPINGYKSYYFDGKHHREGGPAVIYDNGDLEWWIDGRRHREDGPAVMNSDGERQWYKHGELHNLTGPAIIESDGAKQWWIDGKSYSESEFDKYILVKKLSGLSE